MFTNITDKLEMIFQNAWAWCQSHVALLVVGAVLFFVIVGLLNRRHGE